MKRTLLMVLSGLTLLTSYAQDTKSVEKQISKSDWAGARTAIDQMTATDKFSKDQHAWYLKGKVYSQYATDSSLKGQVPGANMTSLEAFKKAYQLDSAKANMDAILDKNHYYIVALYNTTFNAAYKVFQSNDFANALIGFHQANDIGQFLYDEKIGLSALDTVVTYYMAFSHMKLEHNDSATYYFQKLAEAHVSGQGFDLPYNWLCYYYSDKKDWANAQRYADIGAKYYPNDSYLQDVTLERLKDQGQTDSLLAYYQQILSANPNSYEHQYNYGNTLFGLVYGVDKKPADYEQKVQQMQAAFNKCISLDSTRPEAYLALGKSYYNQAVALNDSIKHINGTTPADAANKKAILASAQGQIKMAITPLEKVYSYYDTKGSLKTGEKSAYKSSLSLLGDCYRFLDQNDKAKYYDDKYSAADSK
jgi:hypothetical protein